ncbi:MAG: PAS domain-containing protein [Deltaproteobacteria bacterium]|nr:PAS domain-containing protein [Deltaproteobacteria bacterium]
MTTSKKSTKGHAPAPPAAAAKPPESASYEDLIEGLSEGVIAVDASMRVTVFNQSAEKISELSRTLILGRPIKDFFNRDARLIEMLEKTLSEGKLFAEYEEKLHRRFSGPVPVGITTSQIFDAGGAARGAVAVIKDLSGIKSLEAGTLRNERLAYIGTFAANLAHEIKNPLSGIRGAAQLLTKKIKDESLSDYTGIIIREADHLNRIVNEMLDFARPARLVKKEFNIHQALDAVVFLAQEGRTPAGSRTPSGGRTPYTLKRDYDPSLPPVFGDEGQLKQVFLNLIKNAIEAVGKDGQIQIVTRIITEFHLIEACPREPALAGLKRGMAAVEIRDNGSGIGRGDMDRIFTPFFTTKPKGSGLGLALSLKIIKEHGGHLKIDSTPGAGTAVIVYVPVAEKETQG